MFVVANYDPPGNFIGSFAENVPPIGGFVVAEPTATAATPAATAALPKIMLESSEESSSSAQLLLLDGSLTCSMETTVTSATLTTQVPAQTREVDLERFVAAMLRHHNEFRRKHQAPELQ